MTMACAEPNYTVFYPTDATGAWRAIELAAGIDGPVYVRTSRPKTEILYGPDEVFEVGGSKVLRSSADDSVAIIGAGVTLYEVLKAADELAAEGIQARVIELFSVQPIDRETLAQAALGCGGKIITVEDHYAHRGVGSAVLAALAEQDARGRQLAVRGIARSGKPDELLDQFGISARHIAAAAQDMLG